MEGEKYDYDVVIKDIDVQRGESSHTKILQMVTPGWTVLECGPGNGLMTRYMREKLNCSVYIVEYDEQCFEQAMRYADGGLCANLEDDGWMEQVPKGSFDCVIYADVLEHLRDPEAVLKKMKVFLKPQGVVLLSVPNVANGDIIMNLLLDQFRYTPLGLLDNTHIHLFARESLRAMVEGAGYCLAYEGCTRVPLFATEQGAFIPEERRAALEKALIAHPTRNIYQYVFKLTQEPTDLVTDIDAEHSPAAEPVSRFYFDLGDGFSELGRVSVQGKLSVDGKWVYRVRLPKGCAAVRFDPVENQSCVMRNTTATVGGVSKETTPLNGTRIGAIDFFADQDPQLLIAPVEGGKTLRLETELSLLDEGSWLEVSGVLGRLYGEASKQIGFKEDQLRTARELQKGSENQLQEMAAAKEQTEAELQAVREALANGMDQLREMAAVKKQTDAEMQTIREALENGTNQLQEMTAAKEQTETELQAAREALEEISEARARTEAALQDSRRNAARIESELETATRLRIRTEALLGKAKSRNLELSEQLQLETENRQRTREELDKTYASKSWKITKPLRVVWDLFR